MESKTRETVKFTTPFSKDVIECYSYITGKESRELSAPFFSEEGTDKAKLYTAAQDASFRAVIKSINGLSTGQQSTPEGGRFDVVEHLLEMRKADFQFVVDKINDIVSDKSFEDVKKN